MFNEKNLGAGQFVLLHNEKKKTKKNKHTHTHIHDWYHLVCVLVCVVCGVCVCVFFLRSPKISKEILIRAHYSRKMPCKKLQIW